MSRKRNSELKKAREEPLIMVIGVWNFDDFVNASSKGKSWWQKNILNFPEIAEFSNWNSKRRNEQWAFDAKKAHEWLLNKFVYARV
ncbi:hypothetical protein [Listeria booriae]|uniref:hypothetical protein n=1 Tax=Listeria booriae TaxID=1552123 RepID=UPI00162A324D|nr:hypothetical protein [Listeria booriae]MBC1502404.1 hypothetical protein [Listeria booriae]